MNYGFTALSLDRLSGLASLTSSAAELDAFVSRVQGATGAAKVDIVGHSQGGSVPMWWIKKMGGAPKVAHYVGLAPSSHGTTLNGIVELGKQLNLLGFVTGLSQVAQIPGVLDQQVYSDYTEQLWSDGNAVPAGPKYTVISTRSDEVVTPYTSQALNRPGVTNLVLQDKCRFDLAGHIGLFDGPAGFQPWWVGFGQQLI